MSSTCDVCGAQPHKYKCPSCTVKYCSLACFKTHKPIHDSSAPAASASAKDPQNASATPPTQAPAPEQPPSDPLQRLLADPALQTLLQKHPNLRAQLLTIYTSTLEPDPDEWAEQQQQQQQSGRGRGRGGRGRGRGGGAGMPGGQRARGPWKQETADKNAVGQILRAQEREGGEAMREFVELVQRALGGEAYQGLVLGEEGKHEAVG
ncbi:hypothetical protein B0J12DRAFT_565184 [Macrophomina phaseolina]|uniref:Zinc finger HIT-type protein n=1 Tax=Macrophomina phaseolina TaxID=35725 RepID=A0ABQ8GN96_9PEZI|nr:hypothetical protein B0J12DRAFT_565184 [Macrophomina phaseolina]